jgi:hypothetical protein
LLLLLLFFPSIGVYSPIKNAAAAALPLLLLLPPPPPPPHPSPVRLTYFDLFAGSFLLLLPLLLLVLL